MEGGWSGKMQKGGSKVGERGGESEGGEGKGRGGRNVGVKERGGRMGGGGAVGTEGGEWRKKK